MKPHSSFLRSYVLPLCLASLLLPSCGLLSEDKPVEKKKEAGRFFIDGQAFDPGHANMSLSEMNAVAERGGGTKRNAASIKAPEDTDITDLTGKGSSQSEVERTLANRPSDGYYVWSNADDPDNQSEEMDALFSKKARRSAGWGKSYTQAMRQARSVGTPVLVWFDGEHGDSKFVFSPKSKALAGELLRTPTFLDWARDNLACVRFSPADDLTKDLNVPEGSSMSHADLLHARRKYVAAAHKHFNVKRYPTLIMVSPTGNVLQRWTTYDKGTAGSLLHELKHCTTLGRKDFEKMHANMAQKGFRTWTGKNGATIFAAPVRHDVANKQLWLREYDGKVSAINISNLSKEDQAFLPQAPIPTP